MTIWDRLMAIIDGLSRNPKGAQHDEASFAVLVDRGAADEIWKSRSDHTVTVDWKEGQPNGGRHSYITPDVHFFLPDNREVVIECDRAPGSIGVDDLPGVFPARVRSADGQKVLLQPAPSIISIHHALMAEQLAHDLGRIDLSLRLPLDATAVLEELCIAEIERTPPVACSETYVHQHRVTNWVGERPPEPAPFDQASPWSRLHGETLLRLHTHVGPRNIRVVAVSLSHPQLGVVVLKGDTVAAAIDAARTRSIETAFTGRPIHHAPTIPGNAVATRLFVLASEALSIEPDLADDGGARIDTLLRRHLPDLLAAHARASRNAAPTELGAIDAEMARGIDAVRKSVDEALARMASSNRDALRIQAAFLEMRAGRRVD